ncbi:MAG: sigma factor [Candidatus Micrarchaeota archaeon]
MAGSRLKSWEALAKELEPFIERDGNGKPVHLPSQKFFARIKRSDISNAISLYHGGYTAVREKLGLPVRLIGERALSRDENLLRELQPFVEKLGRLPTRAELEAVGKTKVSAHLTHAGATRIAQLLGTTTKRKFGALSLLRPENLRRAIAEAGLTKLTKKELHDARRFDIERALRLTGLRKQIQQEIGAQQTEIDYKTPLADWQKLRQELEKIEEAIGHFPNDSELLAIKRTDVRRAIQVHHDGMKAVKTKYGVVEPARLKRFVYKPPTDEERQLIAKTRAGGRNAMDSAFQHWRYIISQEISHLWWHPENEDLRQEASLGLVESISRAKHADGFEAYARKRVRGRVYDWLHSRALLKIGRTQRIQMSYLGKRHKELRRKLGRPPSQDELSKATGFSVKEINELTQARKRRVQLREER